MYPLENIRILDLTNLLPGSFSTMILSDLGAEVIKIEKPTDGNSARQTIPGLFEAIDRGKKSVELDLKNEVDKEILRNLIKESDVLIEGFKPGVMKKLGFAKEDAEQLNSSIIYCSISGYGQDGPYSLLPGHDLNYLAVSGMLSISGDPKGSPEAAGGVQIAELATSLFTTISILAALLQRTTQQDSVYIDVSMVESALAFMIPRIAEYHARGEPSKDNFMGRGAYGTFKTKDNQYIAIACVEDMHWEKFCETVGMKEFLLDEMFNSWMKRMENAEIINDRIAGIIAKKTLVEWMNLFAGENIPISPVNSIKDLVKDPQLKYRKSILKKDGKLRAFYPAKFENVAIKKQ
ncbi:CaiB/BaiF CoA transferase family protein [Solibacillus sp. FSL K6-1523]|uniref:CaiB/BaiF CoA transferase family protein n=1 Tax=Solibacillus sp. FSL K6-1523 TaxID=2921471 RepID=UPI0030F90055